MLRLHHLEPASRSNGPGLRSVIWVQGCSLGCPGCFNPKTHVRSSGMETTIPAAVEWVLTNQQLGIEGITISGGEPLQQPEAVAALIQEIKEKSQLSILLFSGFSWEEIKRIPDAESILDRVDVLLAGRYRQDLHVANGLIGSSNKSVHLLTNRYTLADLEEVPQAEVIISPDGDVRFSGIDPLEW